MNSSTDNIANIINTAKYPLDNSELSADFKNQLDENGILTLPDFLMPAALAAIQQEGEASKHKAYYTSSTHNIYLRENDAAFAPEHPRNRQVVSSKGCITTDQIAPDSPLAQLYDSPQFRAFLCAILGEQMLYEYADTLSSINLHYASAGQELGWHFDNSSFAITLLIQKPSAGGVFEYVDNVRNADKGEMNFADCERILNGDAPVKKLAMEAGTLVLFRGRDALHRVTPTEGDTTRMLAVLAYNTTPGVALSESARLTFFGRLR